MSWNWSFLTAAGAPVVGGAVSAPANGFPSQGEAETWVGEVWRDLLADGVDAVTLFEDGREVYGPMSLHPTE